MCWIGWYKVNGDKSYFSDFELAWTSYQKRTFIFKEPVSKSHKNRIHPTQKPITLYDFCYMVAKLKQGDLILDTHLGSGSSRIAAYKGGFNFVGFEIDQEYFDKSVKRFEDYTSQLNLF
jgi:site-specific DNA-methyltransferase (adenine-specific)